MEAINSPLRMQRRIITIKKRALYAQNSINRQSTFFDNARWAEERGWETNVWEGKSVELTEECWEENEQEEEDEA